MSTPVPKYTNTTLLMNLGEDVVHMHSKGDPLSDFYLSRDWFSDVIEVTSPAKSAVIGEVSVRFDIKDWTPISVLDESGWRPPRAEDEYAVTAARGRCAIVRDRLSSIRPQKGTGWKQMRARFEWFRHFD